ncbi:MAG: iron-sulfur protein [Candidatus Margulisiibacteriota bacterium]|nr:MAG: hypothetical protein A2X43_13380 [Candidatus Margulisbacteria bacterium GWD2_39_127]OGI04751.1 MAG: hypothetical protein A2X42_10615 [Candidatus Margulisbacteria bacterium GWF2_38_17]OGI05696.1 MAG: hypothetical protein A2X41_03200 [Candidatus Margulisbacteria bacterium GWE2_39_32]PZM83630.1 MAG: iron-sulfur protein [Candidatus Margulisiibacteriota bacterium]HAR62048.1 iron-sulfur protein [Candidatus Margulisiibacteriota bacterium]
MAAVSIVKCDDYMDEDLVRKVEEALSLVVDLKSLIRKGSKVLLKPNILMGLSPDRAVTTHPRILWAVGVIVKKYGGELWIGDSSGFGSTQRNAQKTGMYEVIEQLGAKLIPFNEPVEIAVENGRLVRHFKIEKAVTIADVIINIPKLKTHGLTYFTGAAKNLYGCLPGLEKGKGHVKMPSRELFSHMIVDLNTAVIPHINIMDAVIGMEGNGPSNGTPRKVGLIMASTNTFALDAVACEIIGLPPQEVPFLTYASDRDLVALDDIETRGENIQDVKIEGFQLIKQTTRKKELRNKILMLVKTLLKGFLIEKPVLIVSKCARCSICGEVCPVKVIQNTDNGPVFNYDKCIHCYCCQELCPHGAIELKKIILPWI